MSENRLIFTWVHVAKVVPVVEKTREFELGFIPKNLIEFFGYEMLFYKTSSDGKLAHIRGLLL